MGGTDGVFATLGDGGTSAATTSQPPTSDVSSSENGDVDTDSASSEVETSSESSTTGGSSGSDESSGSDSSGSVEVEHTQIGVFRPSDRTWTLDDGSGAFDNCNVDACLGAYGAFGDIPVTGNWAGAGATAIGVFRPSDRTWTLDDGSGAFDDCSVDVCLGSYGASGDIPVTGDWTGTGTTAIGVFRPSDATWTLDDGSGAFENCNVDNCLGSWGGAGDIPVTGDWDGTGTTKIGVFRPSEATWWLDDGNGAWDGCGVDICVGPFGAQGDIPVTGDWNGTGSTKIGVFRPSEAAWSLDDGDGAWNGCAVDTCLTFGNAGDVPITGRW